MQQSDSKIAQHDKLKRDNEENITHNNSVEKNDITQIHINLPRARELYSKACNYDSQGNYVLALQYYQNALLQSVDELPLVKAQLLYSIACKYDQLNQTKLALENYLESLNIYNSENNNPIQIAPILYSIGAKHDD